MIILLYINLGSLVRNQISRYDLGIKTVLEGGNEDSEKHLAEFAAVINSTPNNNF